MNDSAPDTVQEVTQGIIAVTVVIGSLAVSIIGLVAQHNGGDIPVWLAVALGAVTGWYFGARQVTPTVRAMTNGPLHTIADLAQRHGPRATDNVPTPTTEEPKWPTPPPQNP